MTQGGTTYGPIYDPAVALFFTAAEAQTRGAMLFAENKGQLALKMYLCSSEVTLPTGGKGNTPPPGANLRGESLENTLPAHRPTGPRTAGTGDTRKATKIFAAPPPNPPF